MLKGSGLNQCKIADRIINLYINEFINKSDFFEPVYLFENTFKIVKCRKIKSHDTHHLAPRHLAGFKNINFFTKWVTKIRVVSIIKNQGHFNLNQDSIFESKNRPVTTGSSDFTSAKFKSAKAIENWK